MQKKLGGGRADFSELSWNLLRGALLVGYVDISNNTLAYIEFDFKKLKNICGVHCSSR